MRHWRCLIPICGVGNWKTNSSVLLPSNCDDLPVTQCKPSRGKVRTPQYQVVVKLDQFDGIPGDKAVLRGLWHFRQ